MTDFGTQCGDYWKTWRNPKTEEVSKEVDFANQTTDIGAHAEQPGNTDFGTLLLQTLVFNTEEVNNTGHNKL